jgi:hypothetical protein
MHANGARLPGFVRKGVEDAAACDGAVTPRGTP